MRALGCIAVGAALLMLTGGAQAWTGIASHQPAWCGAAPYALEQSGSVDLGLSETERIVHEAMQGWTEPSCSGLQLDWRGLTATRPLDMDGESVIGWVENGWPYEAYAIGVTVPSWSGPCMAEADLALNGVNFTWVDGSSGGNSVDTYSIVLHEAGHYFGLGHSSDNSAVMYYAYSGGVLSLNSDDQAGICALYPADGSGGGCETTGCPDGYTCVDSSCQPKAGSADICAACSSSAQCGGSNDFCLMYPDGNGYCGRSCASSADCDGGDCVSVSGTQQCVRFDEGGEPSCQVDTPPPPPPPPPPPSGCSSDADCASDEICDGNGDCIVAPPPRPPSGCSDDRDCGVGEVCDSDGSCVAQPDANPPETDPPEADNTGPGLPPPGAPGEVCLVNEDCVTELCLSDGEVAFCSQTCSEQAPCPGGLTCTGVLDGASLCVPDAISQESTLRIGNGLSCAAAPVGAGASWVILLGLLACVRSRRSRS